MAKTFDEFLDGEYAEPKTIDSTIKQMAGTVARNLTTIGSVVVIFAFVCIFLFDLELNTKLTVGLAADSVVSAILFHFFRKIGKRHFFHYEFTDFFYTDQGNIRSADLFIVAQSLDQSLAREGKLYGQTQALQNGDQALLHGRRAHGDHTCRHTFSVVQGIARFVALRFHGVS